MLKIDLSKIWWINVDDEIMEYLLVLDWITTNELLDLFNYRRYNSKYKINKELTKKQQEVLETIDNMIEKYDYQKIADLITSLICETVISK